MTLREIAKFRLVTQQIGHTKFKSGVEMVRWFGGMQAQEFAHTKWSLGLRLPHLTDADIEKDFNEGKILRTHVLRPTWHFVTSEDIGWLLSLTAPRVHAANAYMYRQLELDNKVFSKCNNILVEILEGGKHLTRDAINDEFQKKKITAKGHRLSYIMMQAELSGLICSGARQGNQFTYALLEERIPQGKPMSQDEALAELSKRYFLSRGPATVKDFSTWSGLKLSDCKKGVEMLKADLSSEIIDREAYFFTTGAAYQERAQQEIHLLPVYDEFIMGYKDRSALMVYRNSIIPPPKFKFDSMIVFEGQIVGTWKRTIAKKSINLEYAFFQTLNRSQLRAFEEAAQRLGQFFGLDHSIT